MEMLCNKMAHQLLDFSSIKGWKLVNRLKHL
jgi:hypothetical protein